MSLHIFGNILTGYGCAANNRGETEGNITTLQKLLWIGNVHTTVSSEAIRWALRYYWQINGLEEHLNRTWDEVKNDIKFKDLDYNAWHPTNPQGNSFIDDDLLGFMDASAGNEESEMMFEIPRKRDELKQRIIKAKKKEVAKRALDKFECIISKLIEERNKMRQAIQEDNEKDIKKIDKSINALRKKAGLKSIAIIRRGVLEISRAISTTPYAGDISFNAKSGKKGRTSLYGAEIHATRYQYGFSMTPERLREKSRCLNALDAIIGLGEVAGNHSRFLYDFSPESIVLRVSEDPAPRILYCFSENGGNISAKELVRKVTAGDISGYELFIGGLASDLPEIKELGIDNCYPGVKKAMEEFKKVIQQKLEIGDEK